MSDSIPLDATRTSTNVGRSGWVTFPADLRTNVTTGLLSTDAFALYVASAGYCSQWGVDSVRESVCRFALGRMSRKTIRELIESDLWEPLDDRQYFVKGEGSLWRRGGNPSRSLRRQIPQSIRVIVYARDGWACLECGATEHLTLDHIHPHSLGGSDEPENLQTLCRSCNSRKGARV